ncbi:hypothetical protein ABZS86_11365 [Streptomyces sp. NPDC005355]|uniref:hypothetical protein n=1 Tax=Streptomyces sp. NPDC005355 TaxID=3157038 RepID=UPI0033AD9639
MKINDTVTDPEGDRGTVTRLYTEGGVKMAEVTYEEERWTGDHTLDWATEDLTRS